jgi:hypothetical protein
MMQANVGGMDKIARIVIGLTLLAMTIVGPRTLWGLIGAIPLATALLNFCPAYTLLGLNTCKTKA